MPHRWQVNFTKSLEDLRGFVKLIGKILARRATAVCSPEGIGWAGQHTDERILFVRSSPIFLWPCFLPLLSRPIVPRETEIFNWKRPRASVTRARATFIIPRSMIKIKSPAVSRAENRCVGRSETGKNPGKLREKKRNEKRVQVGKGMVFFFARARRFLVSRELFYGGAPS